MARGTTTHRRSTGALARGAFAIASLIGIALLAVWLSASEPSASRAADRLVDVTTPVVTKDSLRGIRADLDQAESAAADLGGPGIDRLAAASGQTRAQYLAQLEQRDPQLAEAMRRLPAVRQLAENVVTNLERRQGQFDSATELPGLGLSLHDSAIGVVALAVLIALLGAAAFLRPSPAFGFALLGIGLALAVTPLALGNPGKAADTDALLGSLRPFAVQKVQARADALATARRVFDGFRPLLTDRVADGDPRLSTASLAETQRVLDRFDGLVDFSRRIQPLLVEADTLSARATTWILIAAGALLALAGAVGIGARRTDPSGGLAQGGTPA